MKKKILIVALIFLLVCLGGCSLIGDIGQPEPEVLIGGTMTANILNYGFAVQDEEDILFLYTGEDTYEYGSVVRSNPQSGENSLVLDEGGLYMSIVDDSLFYCRPDGVYRAPLDTKQQSLIMEGNVSLLQFYESNMYFIKDGGIESASVDGTETDFTRIDNAQWLNVYNDGIWYVDTQTGYIHEADMNGNNDTLVLDTGVDMFYILDDVIYYIDSADGYIKRMAMEDMEPETVVAYPCSGFNINRDGMYYTRNVDGYSLCCTADVDGQQENIIEDFGQSKWHVVCMFGDGAMVIGQEDLMIE